MEGHTNTLAWLMNCTSSGRGSISSNQKTSLRRSASSATCASHLSLDLGRVRGAGTEHDLSVRVEGPGRLEQVRDALLAGDPPDEEDHGDVGVDAQAVEAVRAGVREELVRVDAVVDHLHLGRGQRPGKPASRRPAWPVTPRSRRRRARWRCVPPSWTTGSPSRVARPSTAAAARGCGTSSRGAGRKGLAPGTRRNWRTTCGCGPGRRPRHFRPCGGRRRPPASAAPFPSLARASHGS